MSFNKKQLQKDTKELNKAKAPKKSRDIIYDPAGQWKFPGQDTRIPGGNITMQGVPYPVYAQPNVGQPQMMYPGAEYIFPGADYVDEYPQMKKGGRPRGLIPMPKPTKKGLNSKAYSRSLDATNRLFTENYLFKKPKDKRRKVFDPNAKYPGGGNVSVEGYNEDSPWLGEQYKDLGATLTSGRFNVSAGNYFPTRVNQPIGMINPYISAGVDLNKGRNLSFETTPGYTGFSFTKSFDDGGEYGMPLGTGVSQNFIGNRDEFKVGGIPELPLRDNQVNYDAYVNRFEPKTRLYEDGGEYIETELTDDEIQAYRKGGYIVEDISIPSLNQYPNGGGFKRRKKKQEEQEQLEYRPPVEVNNAMYESVTPYPEAPEEFKQGVGNIKEVEVAPDYIGISREYSKKNPKQEYIDKRKKEYLKGTNQGLIKLKGYNMENFPPDVEKNFEKAYNYKRNSYIVKRLGKMYNFSPNRRGEWVANLSPAERNVVANSKYESKLQPSLWDRTLAGLVTLTTPFSAQANDAMNRGELPGLTKEEQKEIKDAELFGIPVGGLESLAGYDAPGIIFANAVESAGTGTYGSNYREAPPVFNKFGPLAGMAGLTAEPMANVSDVDAMVLNPLNISIPYDIAAGLPSLVKGAGRLAKTTRKVIRRNADDIAKFTGKAAKIPKQLPGSPNKSFMSKVKDYFDRPPGPLMLGMSKGAVFNKEIKNPDYFLDLMKINKYSPKQKKYFEDLIANVKKQGNVASEKQYEELQRLKTGDMNYGKKGYSKGGIVSELSKKKINELVAQGYIVEEVD